MATDSDSDVKLTPMSHSNSDVAEREFVLQIIALYKENAVLWDASDQHYTNKFRRTVALRKICDALKEYKPDYTVEDLKKKLNILRTNFNKARNKMELRKSILPDEEREPILWYYNDMAFLNSQEVVKKKPMINRDHQTTSPSKLVGNFKRKKISIIRESSPGIKKPENEEDILAKCWAMKLKKLTSEQRLYAEKIINDTLFEAELGTLTRHGVTFNTETVTWTQYSTESHSPE